MLRFAGSTSIVCGALFAALSAAAPRSAGDDLSVISGVERQPLIAATQRLMEALQFSGTPLAPAVVTELQKAFQEQDDRAAVKRVQELLDPLCLTEVNINAESRVKVKAGPVSKQLMQQGWRTFLVKVHNEAGINPELKVESPNAAPVYQRGKGTRQQPRTDEKLVNPSDVPNRWLDVSLLNREPMTKKL
ncbi:MAG TPA: hypothetical protein EYG03_30480, partial [Planctomycetes bacterium]|nr:hypothetical protein [Planctomycetota bacterium]